MVPLRNLLLFGVTSNDLLVFQLHELITVTEQLQGKMSNGLKVADFFRSNGKVAPLLYESNLPSTGLGSEESLAHIHNFLNRAAIIFLLNCQVLSSLASQVV
jgi:hypothetical protein